MTVRFANSAALTATRFARDESGTIAILFGLMFTAFLGIVGVAIDVARAFHTDQRLTASLDAAALAAGRALIDGQLSEDEIRQLALKRLEENFNSGGGNFGSLSDANVTLNRATGAVTIDTTATVVAAMTGFLGWEKFTMPRQVAVIFDQKDIELSIQLDLTGSMAGRKLSDLKTALNGRSLGYNADAGDQGLLDIMLPDEAGANRVRIGLAPYAAGVNLGTANAALVTNNRNAGSGCVYDRMSDIATDEFYGAGRYFKGRADLPSAQPCPTAIVTPLSMAGDNSNERSRLKGIVNAFRADGTTAGQLGTNWAWNILSPNWKDLWTVEAPAPYGEPNTIKAVILMTDGEYNTADGMCDGGCSPYGPRGVRSNQIARNLCRNMKDEGVLVYTIGFQLNHPVAVDTLNQCATSERTAFLAQDGDELRNAFRDIARQLTNLRLTQ